jgi:hypothetical protein
MPDRSSRIITTSRFFRLPSSEMERDTTFEVFKMFDKLQKCDRRRLEPATRAAEAETALSYL